MQNYRCFGSEEQTARLAPLTLLVGPNSTGKTSFLALIRALWDVAFREVVPDFREDPFDLGSFGDIAHNRRGRGQAAEYFSGNIRFWSLYGAVHGEISASVVFGNRGGLPFPKSRRIERADHSMEAVFTHDWKCQFNFRAGDEEWSWQQGVPQRGQYHAELPSFLLWRMTRNARSSLATNGIDSKIHAIDELHASLMASTSDVPRPVANAPVRSLPRRTYDPNQLDRDPEGGYIPSYLASLYRSDADEWRQLKVSLETFGKACGLFDEISVRSFGTSEGDPFQVQVRKFGNRRKGPRRNLIDVGYGVSQALPILVELLKPDAQQFSCGKERPISLLQQPEVHLHPQAQAALGTLFCEVAAGGRQLVVETHSDYIIDRVRMDVRDQTTGLQPENVSILYFEPRDLEVKIHSIRLDEMGNVLGAPPGYRKFFMEEMRRSIGI